MEEIFGYLERITFQNEANGFTVAKMQEPRKRELTCIVGSLAGVQVGESLRCHGTWKRDLAYGLQFQVSSWDVKAPADARAIEKYLSSGMIRGIGPAYAKRIVEKFGKDTLDIIDTSPDELLKVAGVGKTRLKRITTCWQEQKAIREVMIFLQTHGISPTYAQKIYRVYGDAAIAKVQDNPYCLAREINGIGFKRADQIASHMGIEKNSPRRIEAGIEHVLSELCSDGHVCYPLDEFLEAAKEMLEVEACLVDSSAKTLKGNSRIAIEPLPFEGAPRDFIWLRPLYLTEKGIARQLARLQQAPSNLRPIQVDKAVEWVQDEMRMRLAPGQAQAIGVAVSKKCLIITGGPGTGKSTITKAILAITSKLSQKIVLAAPTGRAAKRMAEICYRSASTIHSLLEFDFKTFGFKRNRDNPLDCDLIIIDEASMIDTVLMYSLLKAIPDQARVIFVGDIDQLPSVGPGNVLRDMIDSHTLPVKSLTEIFRQGKGSRIVLNAHRINRGVVPEVSSDPESDFFFIEREEKEDVMNTILGLVSQRIPRKYALDAVDDIQVLAPMRRGEIGIENLNFLLQERLNPKGEELQRGGRTYRVGDKIMQIRNNYQREVFNGDVGRIRSIDSDEQQILTNFEGKDVVYAFADLDEIVLAYAVSIHKYQGSECPCIVMPVHTTHFKMLHRNLLYTGVTRGKKLVILVGSKKAMGIAVRNNEVQRRYTGLQDCLFQEQAALPLN